MYMCCITAKMRPFHANRHILQWSWELYEDICCQVSCSGFKDVQLYIHYHIVLAT